MDPIVCKVLRFKFFLSLSAINNVAGQEKVEFRSAPPPPRHSNAARCGWRTGKFLREYYTENRIWNSNAEANLEGVKAVIQIMAERGQLKPPLSSPTQYVDHSCLEEARKELARR